MKNFKRAAAILLAIMTIGICSACGTSEEPSEATGMANPVHEVATAEELVQASKVPIDAPEGAENVVYSYIDSTGADPIAQVEFKLDGKDYVYRAQMVPNTNIMDTAEGPAPEDPLKFEPAKSIGADLSGMNYEWKSAAKTMVANRDAVTCLNKGKEGFIAWLDVVPGILYCLDMENGASQDLLQNTAEKVFVPAQGEN